jgi:hypothetical protein
MKLRPVWLLVFSALLSGCGSKPVTSKPLRSEVIGVWECADFPAGFLKEVGVTPGIVRSRITIYDSETCTATAVPQRTPYRFINVTNVSWELLDPSRTPSGSWSLEFDGLHFQCRREDGNLVLRYLISGKDRYSVDYKRTEKYGSTNGN